ncbi:molybdopterin dinucleotide binding domain-containing protein [Methermicoccus shengliensis]|uniref:Molybdopterin dinucleotide-binding domain-containing protein n=1 Tax=Methermicoccus shengliensis TaxID=660064 RepID=A0A832W001_9EURY|nr:molybdopterin dinucleotide binding domain-containing protein [Methermicoccus shengliensis]KUK04943.1 MAG: Molybdopterin dinucleotide-binding region [Euryarchaeota archaeon 55_53]KUK30898.1 MAG: Molybdopterin dinucleotide-binding region [Methanosarcinales archeaon 56_1174]MDI3487641.1 formylmethanofuran dehydrogenase subunit [Methanosarcinales archaeon]MDN5294974.1 formylmethanofuran dehydrogenase subunit [Methanosarcinales archaeon]HIH69979.1 hypothetical protein [Methermicoccus shengliensi
MVRRLGELIGSPELSVEVVVYDDVFVCSLWEQDVFSEEFLDRAAIIELERGTLKHLSLKSGDAVEVRSERGRVVVRATEGEHIGAPAMPKSPLSLALTDGCDTRHFSAVIKKASESITRIEDLIEGSQ